MLEFSLADYVEIGLAIIFRVCLVAGFFLLLKRTIKEAIISARADERYRHKNQ